MVGRVQLIPIEDLVVNPSNDRHGEVPNEVEAIATLLRQLPTQMRGLAKDIAGTGEIYVVPLVKPIAKNNYLVFDGNRRVTCLKLLHNPKLGPNEWRAFFEDAAERSAAPLPVKIECRVVEDQDWIDNFLYRVHTGSQSGVGQIRWDNPAKSNFVQRTGKSTALDLAGEIERKLRREGLVSEDVVFRHTNLARLLSSEEFRIRVGLSVERGKLIFVRAPDSALAALRRIVRDLSSGRLNLNHLLRNEEKRRYLDKLEREGVLPSVEDTLEAPTQFDAPPSEARAPRSPPDKKVPRKHLIRDGDILVPDSYGNRTKLEDIWSELKFNLSFGKHDNAIAVLFRVLVELAVENFIIKAGVQVKERDPLGSRFTRCLDEALRVGLIDRKYHEVLRKFDQTEPLLSANTLNKYIHHKDFYPSDHHLRAMWDTLCPFVKICASA